MLCVIFNAITLQSRSTWACELKFLKIVTQAIIVAMSRSTWACELKWSGNECWTTIYKSRSTWACELKSLADGATGTISASRSTWACELKFNALQEGNAVQESRSTWACELKSIENIYIRQCRLSRSTWACELKYRFGYSEMGDVSCHAPRERVSWNRWGIRNIGSWEVTLHVSVWVEIFRGVSALCELCVTLHVSVWVEIFRWLWAALKFMSRSTWACELKWFPALSSRKDICHAPRERVSWNCYTYTCVFFEKRHAPRERVSWNY